MKLLIDECLSQRVAGLLRAGGHDAVHVGDRGLLGRPDVDVMACAVDEERVLVSADTDFGDLLARSNAALPTVVLLRRRIHEADDQAAVIADVLDLAADDIAAGAILVVTETRVRIRSLPVRGQDR